MTKRAYRLLLTIGIIGVIALFIDYIEAQAFNSLQSFWNKTDRNMMWWTNWYALTIIVYVLKNVINKNDWSKHNKWYSSNNFFIYIIVISIAEFFFMWTFYVGNAIVTGDTVFRWERTPIENLPSAVVHIINPILIFIFFRTEKFSMMIHKDFNRKTFYLLLIEPAAWVVWTTLRGVYIFYNGDFENSLDIMPYAPFLDLYWIWDIEGYSIPPLLFRVIWYVWCLVFMYWASFGAFHWIIEANNRGYKRKTNAKNS